MKTLIKLISIGLITFTFGNCSSKKGGGAPAPAPQAKASEMQFNNDGNTITFNGSNFFVNTNDPNCYKGLASSSSDPVVQKKYQEIQSMISTSQEGKGTLSSPGDRSIYLTVRMSNGTEKRYNLRNDAASTQETTLSKGQEIINYFAALGASIDEKGFRSCKNGK